MSTWRPLTDLKIPLLPQNKPPSTKKRVGRPPKKPLSVKMGSLGDNVDPTCVTGDTTCPNAQGENSVTAQKVKALPAERNSVPLTRRRVGVHMKKLPDSAASGTMPKEFIPALNSGEMTSQVPQRHKPHTPQPGSLYPSRLPDPISTAIDAIHTQLKNHYDSLVRAETRLEELVAVTAKGFTDIVDIVGEVRAENMEAKDEILRSINGMFIHLNTTLCNQHLSLQQQLSLQPPPQPPILPLDLYAAFQNQYIPLGIDMTRVDTGGSMSLGLDGTVWQTAPCSPQAGYIPFATMTDVEGRHGGMEGTQPTGQEVDINMGLAMDWLDSANSDKTTGTQGVGSYVDPGAEFVRMIDRQWPSYDPLNMNTNPAQFNLVHELQEALETASILSSGVESLPSDCSREQSLVPDRKIMRETRSQSRRLREKTQTVDYVSHPIDLWRKQRADSKSKRSSRGRSTTASVPPLHGAIRGPSAGPPPELLKEGDGKKGGTVAKWPKKGKNTVKGRKQEILCDECHGRVHWACAGLEDHHKLKGEPWSCPPCERLHDLSVDSSVTITPAQQESCLRPDCILRGFKSMQRKEGDEDQFRMERIIGRRSTGRKGNGDRIWEFLVKWEEWPMYECTWEPAKNISELNYWHDHFTSDAKKAGVDLHWKVAMLPETAEWWDERGDLKIQKCVDAGIEPKTWWF